LKYVSFLRKSQYARYSRDRQSPVSRRYTINQTIILSFSALK
jgi:hypothetical protein